MNYYMGEEDLGEYETILPRSVADDAHLVRCADAVRKLANVCLDFVHADLNRYASKVGNGEVPRKISCQYIVPSGHRRSVL